MHQQIERLELGARALRDAVSACAGGDAATLPADIRRLLTALSVHRALLAEVFDASTRHAQAAGDAAAVAQLGTFRRSHAALGEALQNFLRTASVEGSHLQGRMATACTSLQSLLEMERALLVPLLQRQAEPAEQRAPPALAVVGAKRSA